jgi:hypothetical protein
MLPMSATTLAPLQGKEQELDQEFELDIRISTQTNHSHPLLIELTVDTACPCDYSPSCPVTAVSACCDTGTRCTCLHPNC